MTAFLLPNGKQQYFTAAGVPLVGGKVFTNDTGTNNPRTTWADAAQTTPNLNPVILDGRGEASIFWNGAYRVILQDSLGNTIYTQDGVSIVDQTATLIADLATFNNAAKGAGMVGFGPSITYSANSVGSFLNSFTGRTTAESSAGVTPTFYYYPEGNVLRYGADPTGGADSRTAFSNASLVGKPITVPTGTFKINTSLTVTPSIVFLAGGIIKPALGSTVTLTNSFQAGTYQIFDLSLGGLIGLPLFCSEVWAEWWGARGDNVKTNNEVPFNQAWYALAQVVSPSYGGVIRFSRGLFLHSGTIFSTDNISHRGDNFFYSCILANAATWNSTHISSIQSQSHTPITFTAAVPAAATSATLTANWPNATTTYTVVFFQALGAATEVRTVTLTSGATTATWAGGLSAQNTTNAMALTYLAIFNNRVENCRIHCGSIAAITQALYAPSWQQKCGTNNVFIQNFVKHGINMDNGYGGAAQLTIRQTELFQDPLCVAGGYSIYANFPGYTTGWIVINLEEVQCGAIFATVTFTAALVAATSATLTAVWPNPTGAWNVQFSDGSYRLVTLTNGATTATWAGAVTATANASGISPNTNGISANGRAILNVDNVHFEQVQNGIVLQAGGCLVGSGLKSDGNNTVQNLIQCSGGWTGTIKMDAVERGGATTFILDNSRGPYAWADAMGKAGFPGGAGGGGFSQSVVWPPDPSVPLFSARCVGGAAPSISYQNGTILGVTHPGAGNYRFTMSVSMDGSSLYHVVVASDLTSTWTPVSATVFDVFTRNPAGALTDCNQLNVSVFHSP